MKDHGKIERRSSKYMTLRDYMAEAASASLTGALKRKLAGITTEPKETKLEALVIEPKKIEPMERD